MSDDRRPHAARGTSLVGEGGTAASGPTIDVHAPIDVASIGRVLAADRAGHNVDPRHFLGDIDLTPSHTPIAVRLEAYFPAAVTATYALDGRIEMPHWGRPMVLPVVSTIPVPEWTDPAHALAPLPPWEVPQWRQLEGGAPVASKRTTKARTDIAPPPGATERPPRAAEPQQRVPERHPRPGEQQQRAAEPNRRAAEPNQRAAEPNQRAAEPNQRVDAKIAPPPGKQASKVDPARVLHELQQMRDPPTSEVGRMAAFQEIEGRLGLADAAAQAQGSTDAAPGGRSQPVHGGAVHDREGQKPGPAGKKSGCLGCLLWLIFLFVVAVVGLVVIGIMSQGSGSSSSESGSEDPAAVAPAAPLPGSATGSESSGTETPEQEAMRLAREALEAEARAAVEAAQAATAEVAEDTPWTAAQRRRALREEQRQQARLRRAEAARRRAEAEALRQGGAGGRGHRGAATRGGAGTDDEAR